ncbi:MAG: glucoamylase family protein, partial [Chitinophagaceae bacterium]
MIRRFLLYGFFFMATANAREPLYDYIFFNNSRMEGNYFFSYTNVVGPSYIKNENKKLPVSETTFHTPGNALQLAYQNHGKGLWEAIVYKQQFRGQDHFKKANYFSFWIYNPSSATKPGDFPVFQLMKKDSTLSNKLIFGITDVNAWRQIIMPVDLIKGVDANKPEEIIGVVFSQNKSNNGSHTLYIDDIEFLPAKTVLPVSLKPVMGNARGYAKHVDLEWANIEDSSVKYVIVHRSENGSNYHPVGIQSPFIHRFADFTGETGKTYHYKISFINDKYEETGLSRAVTTKTKAMTDEELLTMVQEACFRYYWEGAERASGLAKENIAGRHNMIASGASGFGMMALISGTERRFITRQQSVDRFIQIVNFLDKAEKFHGVFSHFIDGPTGKVEPFFGMNDNGGDLVETSFLLQGLLAARAYFNADKPKEELIRD